MGVALSLIRLFPKAKEKVTFGQNTYQVELNGVEYTVFNL